MECDLEPRLQPGPDLGQDPIPQRIPESREPAVPAVHLELRRIDGNVTSSVASRPPENMFTMIGVMQVQNVTSSDHVVMRIHTERLQTNTQYRVKVRALPVKHLQGTWSEWSDTVSFCSPAGESVRFFKEGTGNLPHSVLCSGLQRMRCRSRWMTRC